MGAVFVSYRRGDSEGQARALFMELEDLIGKDSVFMDVDSIALGRDFRQILQERLGSCDLMLALIGPDWLDAKGASGNRRLESPTDLVRQEIAAALRRNIPVTPVFVRGAQMPAPERLPDDLKDLAYRNGFELSHNRWESDVREMVKRLGLAKAEVLQESRPPVTVTAGEDKHVVTESGASVAAGAGFGWKTIAKLSHVREMVKRLGLAKAEVLQESRPPVTVTAGEDKHVVTERRPIAMAQRPAPRRGTHTIRGASVAVCIRCGTRITAGDNFCMKCGKPTADVLG